MLLAIDTATRVASIALYTAAGVQAEMTWRSRENHTVELMAQIVHVLELAHVAQSDLQAVAVALGPGSFTGLRVGMSVSKGFAFARQIPILGIPTLDAVACPFALQSLPIWAVLFAGRGRYSVARYTARDGVIARVSDYALVNPDGLVALALQSGDDAEMIQDHFRRALFCGDVDAVLAQKLADSLGARAVIASAAANARRAAFLAELAWARFVRGESDDAASLSPMYMPHESVEGMKK